MFIPPSFFILLLFILFGSWSLHAKANDWQDYQAQATAAYEAGKYQQAEQAIKKAIVRADKADNGKAYKASSLNLLAYIQTAQGNMTVALKSMSEAVSLAKKALGQPDEQVAALLFNQGLLLQQANQPEQALSLMQQAIDDYLSLNSAGNGNLWRAVLVQAQILANDAPNKAVSQLNRAQSGFTDRQGFSHKPDITHTADLALLSGQIEFNQQHYPQVISSLEFAHQSLDRTKNKVRLIKILELLASSYDKVGQTDKSTPIHAQILTLREQQPISMANVMHLNELAMRYQQKKEYVEAEQLYQKALNALKQLNKTESIEQALMLGNLASVKLAEKDNKTALTLFEESYALHQKLDQRPVDAARIAGYIGTLYYNQRQYSRAEASFLQALKWLDSFPEADLGSVLIALENLNALYISWGKENKARPYERRAKDLKKKI